MRYILKKGALARYPMQCMGPHTAAMQLPMLTNWAQERDLRLGFGIFRILISLEMGIGPTRCMEKEEERREQFEDLGKGHWPRNFSGLGLLRLDRGGGICWAVLNHLLCYCVRITRTLSFSRLPHNCIEPNIFERMYSDKNWSKTKKVGRHKMVKKGLSQ